MTATRLLVLGLVRSLGRAHGYVISKELLTWRVDQWANTKTGSIYHALRTLSKEGYLNAMDIVTSDFGPPRTEYEITDAGHGEFFALMNQALSVPETRPDTLSAGLVFLTELTRADALEHFRRRRNNFSAIVEQVKIDLSVDLSTLESRPPHVESLGDFWSRWVDDGIAWTDKTIRTIEAGAYTFADEADKAVAV